VLLMVPEKGRSLPEMELLVSWIGPRSLESNPLANYPRFVLISQTLAAYYRSVG
jgi:hypothetical protein